MVPAKITVNSWHSNYLIVPQCSLDLRNSYHLVRIRQADIWTHVEDCEYLVMIFVLSAVPAIYQTMVNDFLWDFINHVVFVYLEDILIIS